MLRGRYPFRKGFSFFAVEPVNDFKADKDYQLKTVTAEAETIADLLVALSKQYPYTKRPVVIGASQGGDLSYALALLHPEKIGLSVPLLATLDERLIAPAKNKQLPIHVFHGVDDKIVLIGTAKQQVGALQKAQFTSASIKTYAGLGHDISEAMQKDFASVIDSYLQP